MRKDLVHLTRRYWFSASHRLHNPVLPDGENQQIYGKCNNPGGHGHNYFVEVTVAGPVDSRTGMVVNLAELDAFAQTQILDRFDETSLNELPNFESSVPTTENLCVEIYRIFQAGWSQLPSARQARLERVRLEETSSNFFEYRGESPAPHL
ncbi:MAG: 6-pyruvoyl tetrahydrobiopterin synthase [Acidobacteria bacterium RIFCSPLOWO2_12_FULL_59_11]|nr:MAG: 6-pyruvoyl tetrahydrobiopterin synthase [Acidobacteria bacterium RIFCSPLOWO2_12_FULL_59_11]